MFAMFEPIQNTQCGPLHRHGRQSHHCLPFRSCVKAHAVGVIRSCIARSVARSPTSRSNSLTTFADQAVIAIENVRLFDEVQARTRELTESLEQQTATSEVLSVISSSPGELEPVFEAMLENATAHLRGQIRHHVPLRSRRILTWRRCSICARLC